VGKKPVSYAKSAFGCAGVGTDPNQTPPNHVGAAPLRLRPGTNWELPSLVPLPKATPPQPPLPHGAGAIEFDGGGWIQVHVLRFTSPITSSKLSPHSSSSSVSSAHPPAFLLLGLELIFTTGSHAVLESYGVRSPSLYGNSPPHHSSNFSHLVSISVPDRSQVLNHLLPHQC
jgi:hypothetical protein